MKYNYTMEKNKFSNKKILFIVICLLIIAIILGGLFWYLNRDDSYDQFNQYNNNNKEIGTVKHFEEENENVYISIYYPETENKKLNKIVQEYYKNYIKEQKINKKNKDIIYMDYSINEVYKQYLNLNLKLEKYSEDGEVITTTNKLIAYDLKNDKMLTVSDCLRKSYKNSLSGINGVEHIDSDNNRLKIENKELIIYLDDDLKTKVKINYEENKSLIKLANKNIPSNAPLDLLKPADLPHVDSNKKMIAITLDDGPHKTNTLRVVDMFKKYNGRATFLMLGKNVNLYPEVVKKVYEEGFEIGSHSWDHPDLRKLDMNAVNKQIIDTQDEIFKITGFEPEIIRPPYGATNSISKQAIADNGMKIALWNLDTEDWRLKDAIKIKDEIVNKAFNGAVILIHDIHDFTVNGLEMALEELNEKGYQFVTLETLSQYFELKNVIR